MHELKESRLLREREVSFGGHLPRFSHLGFTHDKIRALTRTKAQIEHDGCINTAKWNSSGELLLTGSDDRIVKIWKLSSNYDELTLKHSILTRHRGNIFCANMSPWNPNVVLSAAADGVLLANYIDSPHSATALLSSEDMM